MRAVPTGPSLEDFARECYSGRDDLVAPKDGEKAC